MSTIDFAAARQRLRAQEEHEVEIDLGPQPTLLDRLRADLAPEQFCELVHITLEEAK